MKSAKRQALDDRRRADRRAKVKTIPYEQWAGPATRYAHNKIAKTIRQILGSPPPGNLLLGDERNESQTLADARRDFRQEYGAWLRDVKITGFPNRTVVHAPFRHLRRVLALEGRLLPDPLPVVATAQEASVGV